MSVFIGYPSFMAYQMMKGKKGNNDGFPSIPGTIARYSALGLTNEEMSKNPVWVDKTGNGHDLQMKNFAWGGMSGVGGYNQNFNQWGYGNLPPALQTYTPHKVELNIPSTLKTGNIYSNLGKEGDIYDFTLKIVGLKDGALLRITKGVVSGNIERIEKDGIYKIYQPLETSWDQLRIYIVISNPNLVDLNITIEQLPLYPGALVFDGVDDCGVCENFPILTKEKGYTVVALRSYLAESIGYLVYNGTNAKQSAFAFERSDSLDTWSWGKNSSIRNLLPKLMSYQTSNSYNNNIISTGTAIEGDKLIRIASSGGYCNVAIWELVFLDHDATEEELTKIKDYFVKTYPWLFPDQAWTVTGKTNEDEDRATIANITGNGNDLVLSNVAFSENSGYGSYPFGMNVWNPDYIADQPYGTVHYPNDSKSYATTVKNNATNFRIKFRLRGLPEGGSFLIRVFDMNDLNTVLKTYTYTENGIHEFVYNGPNKPARIILYNGNTPSNISEFYLDIIPEYEGYLVTDGVDDKITSSIFEMGNDWTVIGDWELINTGKKDNAGIVKFDSIVIYNYNPILINIKNGRNNLIPNQNTVNAICSDGRIYSKDWKESIYNEETESTSKNFLTIGYSGNNYTKIAFRNLAIYPTVLSKEDCIKAYNYLQTLKAK